MPKRKYYKEGKKKRFNAWLSMPICDRLQEESSRTGETMAFIIEKVLRQYFDPHKEEELLAAIIKRLGLIERRIAGVDTNVNLSSEFMAVFIRTWLLHTPDDLPKNVRDTRKPDVSRRITILKEVAAQSFSEGKTLLDQVTQEINKTKSEPTKKTEGKGGEDDRG